jgi:hypothetical protein
VVRLATRVPYVHAFHLALHRGPVTSAGAGFNYKIHAKCKQGAAGHDNENQKCRYDTVLLKCGFALLHVCSFFFLNALVYSHRSGALLGATTICWVVPGLPMRLIYETNPNLRFRITICNCTELETSGTM